MSSFSGKSSFPSFQGPLVGPGKWELRVRTRSPLILSLKSLPGLRDSSELLILSSANVAFYFLSPISPPPSALTSFLLFHSVFIFSPPTSPALHLEVRSGNIPDSASLCGSRTFVGIRGMKSNVTPTPADSCASLLSQRRIPTWSCWLPTGFP